MDMTVPLWICLAVTLGAGYVASLVSCLMEQPSDTEWWMPFVMAIVVPFWWLGKNWRDIVGVIGIVVVLVLVFVVAGLVGELVNWLWRLI